MEAMRSIFGEKVEFELISDICHSRFEVDNEQGVWHLRGLQKIYPKNHKLAMPFYKKSGDIALIGGQKGTSSFLVVPNEEIKKINNICSHGTGSFKYDGKLEDVPSEVLDEFKECCFDTGYNVDEELYKEYMNTKENLGVLTENLKIVNKVVRLAPFINYWGEE